MENNQNYNKDIPVETYRLIIFTPFSLLTFLSLVLNIVIGTVWGPDLYIIFISFAEFISFVISCTIPACGGNKIKFNKDLPCMYGLIYTFHFIFLIGEFVNFGIYNAFYLSIDSKIRNVLIIFILLINLFSFIISFVHLISLCYGEEAFAEKFIKSLKSLTNKNKTEKIAPKICEKNNNYIEKEPIKINITKVVPNSKDELNNNNNNNNKEIDSVDPDKIEVFDINDLNKIKVFDNICSICREEFHTDDKINILTCGHAFHSICIINWFRKGDKICPNCNANIENVGKMTKFNTEIKKKII